MAVSDKYNINIKEINHLKLIIPTYSTNLSTEDSISQEATKKKIYSCTPYKKYYGNEEANEFAEYLSSIIIKHTNKNYDNEEIKVVLWCVNKSLLTYVQ